MCAQTRYHELGLRTGGLNSFDVMYKRSSSGNTFLRLRVLSLRTQLGSSLPANYEYELASFAVGAGLEWRVPITETLYFVHGPELYLSGDVRKNSGNNSWFANIRPGYVIGFNYPVSDKFIIGLESIPGLGYYFGENSRGERAESLAFGLNNSVALTALYRFSSSKD